MPHSIERQAQALLERLALYYRSSYQGYSSVSASIYDTAWLSLVQKPRNSGVWLFPESFEYILKHQLDSGGWPCQASLVDGILNTASALLSLQQHLEGDPKHQDWMCRRRRAQRELQQMLDRWDLSVCDEVRSHILVANHLSLLHDAGLDFEFSQVGSLTSMRNAKLPKLPLGEIKQVDCIFYHPLEAFIGHIDFDGITHWLDENGSMMGSLASTAAYLMHTPVWDDRAELYLRNSPTGRSIDGSVPCAWPMTLFEVATATTTLLEVGIAVEETEISEIINFLEQELDAQRGTIEFNPSLADVDGSIQAMIALAHAGKKYSISSLIEAFSGEDHFKTYEGERNASFSTNCNILMYLLTFGVTGGADYVSRVAKAARFLCDEAFRDTIKEKWHTHRLYWMMLLSQAIQKLYESLEDKFIQDAILQHHQQLREQLPMVSIQLLRSILLSQQVNGSWDDISEVTAYSILALSNLSRLPWIQDLDDPRIVSSISNGKLFLRVHRNEWGQDNSFWIRKVTGASGILSEAYCLAADTVSILKPGQIERDSVFLPGISVTKEIQKARLLLEATSMAIDVHEMRIAERQACYALISLQRRSQEVFPALAAGKNKYMGITTLIWMACSLIHNCPVSLAALSELMALSMFVYQVDEFMESVVEKECGNNLEAVKTVVHRLCSDPNYNSKSVVNSSNFTEDRDGINGHSISLGKVTDILGRFVSYFRHPAVESSPAHLHTRVSQELETFLLAHITHAEDNLRLQKQGDDVPGTSSLSHLIQRPPSSNGALPVTNEGIPPPYLNPGRTFFNWVRSTSADHTSCPLSFAFYCCIAKQGAINIFSTPRVAYVAEDMCRHLSTMCRMYNDYGSVVRDKAEVNLNSLNFPEFHGLSREKDDKPQSSQAMQKMMSELMWIAEYERHCLDAARAQMGQLVGLGKVMDALNLYIDVTDMYGRVYLLKDLTNRVK